MTTKPTLKLVHSSEIAEKSKKLPADYEGEMLLIWSVLYRAMLDALGHYRVSSEDSYSIVEDARDWIGVYDDSTQDDLYKAAPFSYEWACLMLGLDPTTVRKFVKAEIEGGCQPVRCRILGAEMQDLVLYHVTQGRRRYEEAPFEVKYKGERL
jgi:hypothetical protein